MFVQKPRAQAQTELKPNPSQVHPLTAVARAATLLRCPSTSAVQAASQGAKVFRIPAIVILLPRSSESSTAFLPLLPPTLVPQPLSSSAHQQWLSLCASVALLSAALRLRSAQAVQGWVV